LLARHPQNKDKKQWFSQLRFQHKTSTWNAV
jgi:hypothetical protein